MFGLWFSLKVHGLQIGAPENTRTTYHVTSSGKMKQPPFNFLDFCCRKWGEEPYRGDCMYLWLAHSGEYGWTRYVYHSCSWPDNKGKLCFPCPSSRLRNWSHGTGSAFLPLPTKASTYIPSTDIGLAPNLHGHAIACRWRSLPRVRWHSACSNIPLSTVRYVKRRKNTMPRFEQSTDSSCLKKNQNAPRPSEHPPVMGKKMSKRLGGIKGCKYKTS